MGLSLRRITLLAVYLCASTTSAHAAIEDDNWWHGFAPPPDGQGMNSTVSQLIAYDGALVAIGGFTESGGSSANRIAQWDGDFWKPLGSGFVPAGGVYAPAIFNDQLVVPGGFTQAGGVPANHVARWDGEAWHPLGEGLNAVAFVAHVYNSALVVGGHFTRAGGVPVNHIAQWDGVTWAPLGGGITPSAISTIDAMAAYEGKLIVSGQFSNAGGVPVNNIAAWNGVSWSALGDGVNERAHRLAVYDDQLVVGGFFTAAGGTPANGVAVWDGVSWDVMDEGLDPLQGPDVIIDALGLYNGNLIAGGRFQLANTSSKAVARWNGENWEPLGSGLRNDPPPFDPSAQALFAYEGSLYVGGHFDEAGNKPSSHIARWDDEPFSIASATTPEDFYENGVDTALFTVVTRSNLEGSPSLLAVLQKRVNLALSS